MSKILFRVTIGVRYDNARVTQTPLPTVRAAAWLMMNMEFNYCTGYEACDPPKNMAVDSMRPFCGLKTQIIQLASISDM